MTYKVQFRWDKWGSPERTRPPLSMRRCNSIEEADNYAVKLSTYDELLAQLDEVLALSTAPMGFRETERAAA